MVNPTMVSVVCENSRCGNVFQARVADRKRGWGRFCCKSCKATVSSYGTATPAPKSKPKKVKKPGPPGGTPSKKPPKPSMRDNPKPESYGEWS